MMEKNVGGMDRWIRIVVGLVLLGLTYQGTLGSWGWVVGAIALATGVFSMCGLYKLLGINTCKVKSA